MEREKAKKLGSREVPKLSKNNKIFYCYLKRLSKKYRKNSKTTKLNKILEREKATRSLEKIANFAKNAKVSAISQQLKKTA